MKLFTNDRFSILPNMFSYNIVFKVIYLFSYCFEEIIRNKKLLFYKNEFQFCLSCLDIVMFHFKINNSDSSASQQFIMNTSNSL